MRQESYSYANLANLQMMESLYEQWLANPDSVDISWKNFFEGMQFAAHLPKALPARTESNDLRAFYLINAYRTYGHLLARCNCIDADPPPFPEELKLENFGLSEKDMDTEFPTENFLKKPKASLREIIDALQKTYCQSIGIEYMDLGSVEIEKWVQQQIEPNFPTGLSNEDKLEILYQLLNQAEGFETFLHTKYVGQKRFSLEGAESLIPILHTILNVSAKSDLTDAVIGMAHRGRLNVLANIMGKSYGYIFSEFEDFYMPNLTEASGDVKYHMGFAGTYQTKEKKKIQLFLSANPSHLEAVDPVVEGQARAIQEQKSSKEARVQVLPLLIHGDAAVAGQGVVYETLTLSRLNGYSTAGTIHIVINNQIGFTTLPKDSRSTRYCTDIAKAFGAPVLHVNAEDAEACVAAARLAAELRIKFQCDVFIDLMGYRKYGHNESDEPFFTQPVQYQIIRSKKSIRQLYRDKLIEQGILTQEKAEAIEQEFHANLTQALTEVKSKQPPPRKLEPRQRGRYLQELLQPFPSGVEKSRLVDLGRRIVKIPADCNIHPKVLRVIQDREKMVNGEEEVNWAMAELLAYASLCTEDVHIRLSGQDVRRGTFSHRHGIYVDQVNAHHYFPLSHLAENQAPVDLFNSPLSEYGVLAFEFGYSLFYPKSLVIWEAQYGDFANGAQIAIDQFISSAEMKWGNSSNLTLFLPHGYVGSGPEHSSGRIERFLQLCAEENMFVANCTTPAQFFHLLRRQALRQMKKPLVVFTPKELLRHPLMRSPLSAFTEGSFQEILDDPAPPEDPKRILLCSGQIYFFLLQEREKRKTNDVLVRIEQFYPFNEQKLKALFQKYRGVNTYIYVQEEHENMGAWRFVKPYIERCLEGKAPLLYIGREAAAVAAAGSHALHQLEQDIILQQLYQENR